MRMRGLYGKSQDSPEGVFPGGPVDSHILGSLDV